MRRDFRDGAQQAQGVFSPDQAYKHCKKEIFRVKAVGEFVLFKEIGRGQFG
jgi:hypothetical protein